MRNHKDTPSPLDHATQLARWMARGARLFCCCLPPAQMDESQADATLHTNANADIQLKLANYLGTGKDPQLTLRLGSNEAGWKPFAIHYAQTGNIPSGWSTWNVYDSAQPNHYYGTITVTSQNGKLTFDKYQAPNNTGYYLSGFGFHADPSDKNLFDFTVKQIHRPDNSTGPFPHAPIATPATYTGTNTPITLKTAGPDIKDDYGRDVQLKGFARPSLEWNPSGQFLSPDDITYMAKWGSNVIRLDLNQQYWLDSKDKTVKGSYKQIVDAVIYYATQNGMAVILDLHWLTKNQSPMPDQKSLTFWKDVATAYKDFGTVIFELYNEPEPGITPQVWLNGDANKGYVGMQALYNVVRKQAGANNLVIVNGTDWGYDLSFVNDMFRIDGTNIIYGTHPYMGKCLPNYQGPGGPLHANLSYVLGRHPVIMTESGCNSPSVFPTGYEPYYKALMTFAHNNGLHYTAFAWWVEPDQPQFPCLIKDWNGTPQFGGVNFHNDMQQYPPTQFMQPPQQQHRVAP